MRVFLTGATGFVGHHILQALLDHGHTVRCLVREGSLDKLPVAESDRVLIDSSKETITADEQHPRPEARAGKVEVVFGDVTEIESIEGDMTGCDAVIHLVGIIEEVRHKGITFQNIHVRGTRNVVEEAKAAGVKRFVQMSANCARPDEDATAYHRTKWEAEEIVREAGLPHAVIFRPSIIFGDPGEDRPEFAQQLATTLIGPFPILPVLGDGRYELQPVHITDIASAFVKALTFEVEEGAALSFCAAGSEKMMFDEALDRIALGMGSKPKPKVHIPLWLSRLLVNTFGAAGLMPISPSQFRMLIDGNTCDHSAFVDTFAPAMTPFQSENLSYLRRDEN